MPVEGLQRHVATLLKPHHSRHSFVGGSSVFNATFPRRSDDIDIDSHVPVGELALRDVATLRAAGLSVDVDDRFYGFSVDAAVQDGHDATKLEWNEADRNRFFPVSEDTTFGWALHRADLAVQKVVAASSRRKPRDAVNVILIDPLYTPLALLAIAAPAKLGNISPIAILDRVLEVGVGHPLADYEALDFDRGALPFPIGSVKMVLADRIAAAQGTILDRCPTAAPGTLYTDPQTDRIGLPAIADLVWLQPRTLSEHGAFASMGTAEPPLGEWQHSDPYRRG